MSRAQDPGMIEKILEAQHVKKKGKQGFLLPKGKHIGEVREWAERIVDRAKQKRIERTDGRTHKEKWKFPPHNYAAVAQQAGETYFPIGYRICEIIANFGRLTIDEIPEEFGALDWQVVTVTVNKMRADGYLKDYIETSKEEKGLLTLELVEEKEHKLEAAEKLGMLTTKSTKSEDDEDEEVAEKIPKKRGKRSKQKSSPKKSLD